jgi:hypothetical protein
MTCGNCHTTLMRAAPAEGTASLAGTRKCVLLLLKDVIDLSQDQKSKSEGEHTLSACPN